MAWKIAHQGSEEVSLLEEDTWLTFGVTDTLALTLLPFLITEDIGNGIRKIVVFLEEV